MHKILIVKRDKLGDLLLTIPLVELLAKEVPGARIDLWATSFTTFLIEDHPCVNRVWPIRKRLSKGLAAILQAFGLVSQLIKIRAQRYDWVISASGEISTRAIRRARMAGGTRLVSFVPYGPLPTFGVYSGVTHGIPLLPTTTHESLRLAKLAEPIIRSTVALQDVSLPCLYLCPKIREAGRALIHRTGLTGCQFVVLGLGARKDKRRPTVAQILSWSDYLLAHGYQCLLSYTPGKAADPGYPSDEVLAREILSMRPAIVPLCGPVEEAVAVISFAAFSVIPDSGLMHVAAASEGGVIALFADPDNSPSSAQWGPRGLRCRVIVAAHQVSDLPDQLIFESFQEFIHRGCTR